MAIPKQVQKQIDEVEALERHIFGDAKPESADPEKPKAEVSKPEAEQDVDARHQEVDTEAEHEVEAEESASEAEKPADDETESKPKKEKPTRSDDDPAYWKQKYKTLQGMYDADVPRLNGQLKEVTKQLEELKAQVDEANKEAKQAKAQAEHERLKNLVTDEDRQEFGEDLIEVQRKVAREELADLVQQIEDLKNTNSELRERLDRTGSEVSMASFEQKLERRIPGFSQLNSSPEWIEWLNEVDPILRAPRGAAAQKAYSEGDIEGVAYYVDLFKKTQQPKPERKKKPSPELENQIQPPRSASSQATPQPKGKVYTNADIQRMFKRVTELGVAGRIDEARKLEAEIDAAYTQGRVAA